MLAVTQKFKFFYETELLEIYLYLISKKDLKLFQNTFFSGRRDLEALHEAICKDCGKGAHGLFRCAEKRFSKSRQRWVDCKYSCWLIYFQSLLQKLSCTIYFDWLLQRLSGNIYFQWLLQKLFCTIYLQWFLQKLFVYFQWLFNIYLVQLFTGILLLWFSKFAMRKHSTSMNFLFSSWRRDGHCVEGVKANRLQPFFFETQFWSRVNLKTSNKHCSKMFDHYKLCQL